VTQLSSSPEATTPGAPPSPSPWRNGDFVRFWLGETVSAAGRALAVAAVGSAAVIVGVMSLVSRLRELPSTPGRADPTG
jgi:hypothetical protein